MTSRRTGRGAETLGERPPPGQPKDRNIKQEKEKGIKAASWSCGRCIPLPDRPLPKPWQDTCNDPLAATRTGERDQPTHVSLIVFSQLGTSTRDRAGPPDTGNTGSLLASGVIA